jgi:FlaA1/EpsC-like NDP-sugar epimerase
MRHKSRLVNTVQTIKYMFFDSIMIFALYMMAIFMFIFLEVPIDVNLLVISIPSVILYKLIVFYFTGLYKMLQDHVGFEDIIKITIVIAISNITIILFIWATDIVFIYKSALIFMSFGEIFLITFPRVLNRIIVYFKTNFEWNRALGKRTLIIGAGHVGELVVKEIYRNKNFNNLPIAFVDNDPNKIGKRLSGIKILGPDTALKYFIGVYKVEEVIIAINNITTDQLNNIVSLIADTKVTVKRLMKMTDFSDQNNPQIIDVKIEDLLNREEIQLDAEEIKEYIKDEVVLVTGGGGSIGSELCRQICEHNPKELIIFDIYENNAYEVQQEILRTFSKSGRSVNLTVLIGSVYNRNRLEYVFKTHKPTLVFHAAAYKHVPLMEDSAIEAVRTNVIGTYNCASLANQYEVKKFVLVSSDKAVRSTNVMGATKRYAELIIQEQQSHSKITKFASVRFGNVLGSNGSVIPLFKKQIADGGPVTVTHKDITRYFMTIPEAVGLILQCGVFAQGGEVFILDMGEPVKIKDLAEKMIKLSGHTPYEDIDIIYTGLRPGEKLFEELLVDHDYQNHYKTDNNKIFIERQQQVEATKLEMDTIIETLESKTNEEVKSFVSHIIPTYTKNGNGHN